MSGGVDNFYEVGGGGISCLELPLTCLVGSGGMPPRKFLTFSCSEIVSGAISLVESWLAVSLDMSSS